MEESVSRSPTHHLGCSWKQTDERSVTLRTTETACGQSIELGSSTVDLISYSPVSESEAMPTSIPFSIPLMADAPQCIHTPQSALIHTLTATVHPVDPATNPIISKDVVVHTRRFTLHTHAVEILPETHVLDGPVRVEAEVPRSTFVVGEPIPVYITIPPPDWELVMDGGLGLRNVKVELARFVEASSDGDWDGTGDSTILQQTNDILQDPLDGPSSAMHFLPEKSSSASLDTPSFPQDCGICRKTVLSRSGASCRFHRLKAVRLRFILYQPSTSSSPSGHASSLHSTRHDYAESDSQCMSITQATLLHRVSFGLNVQISFVDTGHRTERSVMLSIPIVIIPSPAPLPEVEEWVDAAYQKKHDRPPARTVRHEDADLSAPMYQEGEAGPSYRQNGEPPPFEDRDAPPPPFFVSTSNHLPTFQESENEIYISTNSEEQFATPPEPMIVIGEGVLFGFSASQQFDGHLDALRQTSPPPTVEESVQDPDLTDLVDVVQPCQALNSMLERPNSSTRTCDLLPPPLLDDPSDPPPSIDSEFRSLTTHGTIQLHPSTVIPRHSFTQLREHEDSLSPPREIHRPSTEPHAPPPYLTPNEHEQVATPPPYMDFMPPHDH